MDSNVINLIKLFVLLTFSVSWVCLYTIATNYTQMNIAGAWVLIKARLITQHQIKYICLFVIIFIILFYGYCMRKSTC